MIFRGVLEFFSVQMRMNKTKNGQNDLTLLDIILLITVHLLLQSDEGFSERLNGV